MRQERVHFEFVWLYENYSISCRLLGAKADDFLDVENGFLGMRGDVQLKQLIDGSQQEHSMEWQSIP